MKEWRNLFMMTEVPMTMPVARLRGDEDDTDEDVAVVVVATADDEGVGDVLSKTTGVSVVVVDRGADSTCCCCCC